MHIHFIGIAGTAMGNVALLMRAMGHVVTGSDDNVYPPMSDLLANAGCAIMNGFGAHNLDPAPELVVIGNRMSRGNEEVEAVLERGLPYISLPELLKRELIQGRTSIVLTGTHGKTTTSSLIAWILESSQRSPSFMIGGAPGNFEAGWQYRPESQHVVLEGDEYDTAFFDKRSKFVHYLPTVLLINNIEFDHADIYNSLE
ncbi:MAG: UDP-N-acetylmuramate:L-alanyl-gamma-D-glutamyl-meso-diaminopimelate ligase, partial [bacterium]|nr:UDP-N-acetylmuramate:L-alanyl-gamma-D-glutamyl-meso-diaminopimelate ligase [Candidatus Kapabacteria bacterium]